MFLSKFAAFQILQSQGNVVAYFITLPICVLSVVPFFARLFPFSRAQRRVILAVIIVLNTVLILIAGWLTRQHIYNIGYDTWMHLALIQRGVEGGLFTGDPYYPGFPTPPHYSVVDIFYTLLSKISHIAPHLLWGSFSPIFAALIFLSCIWWYRELLGDLVLGWLAGLLFIVSMAGEWHYATYPRNAALILFALSHLFVGIMCLTSLVAYIFMNWVVGILHGKPRLFWAAFPALVRVLAGSPLASRSLPPKLV